MSGSRPYNVNNPTQKELTDSTPVGFLPYLSTLFLAHLAALVQICMTSETERGYTKILSLDALTLAISQLI